MSELFIMRWPELGKEVRVEPIEHNPDVFDWFVDRLPLKCVQGHVVVAGYMLSMMDLGWDSTFPWRNKEMAGDNIAEMPRGRIMFFLTTGKVANLCCKWGEVTEPLSYPTWAQVVEEDLPILEEVGEKIWSIFMGNEKEIVHAEFVRVEG